MTIDELCDWARELPEHDCCEHIELCDPLTEMQLPPHLRKLRCKVCEVWIIDFDGTAVYERPGNQHWWRVAV